MATHSEMVVLPNAIEYEPEEEILRKETRQKRDYLQVWCLSIDFFAIWKRAIVLSFRADRQNSLTTSLILTIWTLTSNASSYRWLRGYYCLKNRAEVLVEIKEEYLLLESVQSGNKKQSVSK